MTRRHKPEGWRASVKTKQQAMKTRISSSLLVTVWLAAPSIAHAQAPALAREIPCRSFVLSHNPEILQGSSWHPGASWQFLLIALLRSVITECLVTAAVLCCGKHQSETNHRIMNCTSSLMGRGAARLVPAFFIAFFFLSHTCAGQTYGDFKYSVSGDDITITEYDGSGEVVTTPSIIPGVSGTVTSDRKDSVRLVYPPDERDHSQ